MDFLQRKDHLVETLYRELSVNCGNMVSMTTGDLHVRVWCPWGHGGLSRSYLLHLWLSPHLSSQPDALKYLCPMKRMIQCWSSVRGDQHNNVMIMGGNRQPLDKMGGYLTMETNQQYMSRDQQKQTYWYGSNFSKCFFCWKLFVYKQTIPIRIIFWKCWPIGLFLLITAHNYYAVWRIMQGVWYMYTFTDS